MEMEFKQSDKIKQCKKDSTEQTERLKFDPSLCIWNWEAQQRSSEERKQDCNLQE